MEEAKQIVRLLKFDTNLNIRYLNNSQFLLECCLLLNDVRLFAICQKEGEPAILEIVHSEECEQTYEDETMKGIVPVTALTK